MSIQTLVMTPPTERHTGLGKAASPDPGRRRNHAVDPRHGRGPARRIPRLRPSNTTATPLTRGRATEAHNSSLYACRGLPYPHSDARALSLPVLIWDDRMAAIGLSGSVARHLRPMFASATHGLGQWCAHATWFTCRAACGALSKALPHRRSQKEREPFLRCGSPCHIADSAGRRFLGPPCRHPADRRLSATCDPPTCTR